jgi:hypothetical protein
LHGYRHGWRKLQNFAARSYCFAASIRVFHPPGTPVDHL